MNNVKTVEIMGTLEIYNMAMSLVGQRWNITVWMEDVTHRLMCLDTCSLAVVMV